MATLQSKISTGSAPNSEGFEFLNSDQESTSNFPKTFSDVLNHHYKGECIQLPPEYQFMDEIMNDTLEVETMSTEDLLNSLLTFHFLDKSSYDAMDEYLFRIGSNRELVLKHFKINKIIGN